MNPKQEMIEELKDTYRIATAVADEEIFLTEKCKELETELKKCGLTENDFEELK